MIKRETVHQGLNLLSMRDTFKAIQTYSKSNAVHNYGSRLAVAGRGHLFGCG